MVRRSSARRVVLGSLVFALASGAFTMWPAGQTPALVRGNAPGEWRYWGADAWSTRYSPLDQINASNFNALQVAWRGTRRSTATTSTTGRRRSTRTAGCSRSRPRVATPTRSIRRTARRSGRGSSTKASAGRKRRGSSPAAASPTGPTARQRARHRRHARLPHGVLDAKTGKPDPPSARTASSI